MEQHRQLIGKWGEKIAANYLKKHGYEIVVTNQRLGRDEIDIIAKINSRWIFVEVKTRTSTAVGGAEDQITRQKIKALKRAVFLYCRQNRLNLEKTRADFIAVDIRREQKLAKIKHFKNIF